MTIRRATLQDLDELCRLSRLEHAQSRMSAQPYEPEKVRQSFSAAVTGMSAAVFVSETPDGLGGLIVGMVQGNLFNRFWSAYEVLWFATDGSGLKLLEALKDWAGRMRCTELVIHNYAGIKSPESFNKVMTRKGFGHLGTSFVAAL